MALVSLRPSQKGVTILIAVAAVIFLGCAFACFGAMQWIKGLNTERDAAEKQVADGRKIAQTQRDSENKYLDTRAQIRCLEASVSTQAYVPTLLKQIERLGKSVDLKVLGVRPKAPDPNAGLAKKVASDGASQGGQAGAAPGGAPGAAGAAGAPAAQKPEPPKPYDELEVDLELEGEYMNAIDFLYRLTSFPKIMAVKSIQMNPGGDTSLLSSPVLNIRMTVTAFVFKEGAPTTQPAAQPGSPTASPVPAANGSAKVEGRAGNEAG